MTTEYYTHGTWPPTGSTGTSAPARSELDLIEAGFAKLPTLAANASKAVIVNAGATALSVTTGTLALAGNFATVGAYAVTLTATAATGVTLPTTGTLSTLAGSETLTNKTLTSPVLTTPTLGTPASGTLTNCTGFPTSALSGLGTGVATFLATPSSANLASAVTDETGSGVLVFGTSPAITTSITTGSTTFSLVNATATTVNFAGGASVALNMGHASGTNTVLGATTFSQALTASTSISLIKAAAPTLQITSSTTNSYTLGQLSADTASVNLQVLGSAFGGTTFAGLTGNSQAITEAVNSSSYVISTNNSSSIVLAPNRTAVVTVNASGMNGVLGATTPAALSATTGAFSGNVAVSSESGIQLTLGGVVASGLGANITLRTGSAKTAWNISAQSIADQTFSITPSTAVGGTTFTTPVFNLTSTGINNTVIGATTPAAASVTTLAATGQISSTQTRAATLTSFLGNPVGGSVGVSGDINQINLLVANTAGGNTAGIAVRAVLNGTGTNNTDLVLAGDNGAGSLVTRANFSSTGLAVNGTGEFINSAGGSVRIDDGAASGTRISGSINLGASSTIGAKIAASVTTYNDVVDMVFYTTPAVGTHTERMRIDNVGVVSITTNGLTVGAAPTGGNKGIGTANFAADIYKNNTAYTNPDYVLEKWATGKIVKFADKDGAKDYTGLMPLRDVEAFARTNLHLPRFGQKAGHGLFSGSDAILASVEESYLHLFNHEARIAKLERQP